MVQLPKEVPVLDNWGVESFLEDSLIENLTGGQPYIVADDLAHVRVYDAIEQIVVGNWVEVEVRREDVE